MRRYLRFWGTNVQADVDAELKFHFDMRVQEYVARGMSEEEARAAVLRRLGDVTAAKAECQTIGDRRQRRRTRVEQLDSLWQDIRLAGRGLARTKGWTTVAILTLALGIGATSTLFTIINAVLLRPLPFPHADRIISISEQDHASDSRMVQLYDYLEWQRSTHVLDAVAVYRGTGGPLVVGSDAEQVQGTAIGAGYFSVFAVAAEHGRTFTAEELRPGGPPVIVLSDQLWRQAFGADTSIIGRPVHLGDALPVVVGVMPPAFTTRWGAQYWVPLAIEPSMARDGLLFSVVARLRPGATIEAAVRELMVLNARVQLPEGREHNGAPPVVMTLHDRRYGDMRAPLLLLLGAVGVLLLIACANVANLMLARGALRQAEFSVRIALGAGRWRLIRYLLSESLLLSLAGGLAGLAIPAVALRSLLHLSPDSIAHLEGVHVDGTVLWTSVTVSLVTGVLFGLVPALDAIGADLHDVLKDAGGRATRSARRTRMRRALVVAEIATALVLVVVAGLFTTSFEHVALKDPGFHPEHVLEAHLYLSGARYPTAATQRAFSDLLLGRVRTMAGVRAATLADIAPLGGSMMSMRMRHADGTESPDIDVSSVGRGYFETLGIPLLAGRTFSVADRDTSAVAVINASMARQLFSGTDPIGKLLPMQLNSRRPITVVGVVEDVPQIGLEADPAPEVYQLLTRASPAITMLIRTSADPESIEPAIRRVVAGIDQQQPVASFETMEQAMSDTVAPRRFSMALLGIFASLATALAAIGLYGIMAYAVAERTHELGVRIALGADTRRIARLVIGEGMALTATGILLGVAGSFVAVRALGAMLYRESIYDPSAFLLAAGVLAVVSLLASYVPARRATRVDPAVALRGE